MSARTPTPSQTVGPFFGFALPFEGGPDAETGGVRIEGRLLDGEGAPVPDGLIEVWAGGAFSRCRTDAEGAYHAAMPLAPHYEVTVFARGLLRHLATRIYPPGAAPDAVLEAVDVERRATLMARRDGEVLVFDINLQGPRETVFFEL